MAHKVVFRDDAVADLAALYDYIANHNSPEIASDIFGGFKRRVRG